MIYLLEIDSTNKYAKQLIQDGLSAHGQVIWTNHQTQGQGQRSKTWQDEKGKSVLMSLIFHEQLNHLQAFQVNSLVASCVLNVLKTALPVLNFYIKWPNDIFVNDKKTCGILIENGWAGTAWKYAIVGIGINVLQEKFSADTPLATSLKIESGISLSIPDLIENIKTEILSQLEQAPKNANLWFENYNTFLPPNRLAAESGRPYAAIRKIQSATGSVRAVAQAIVAANRESQNTESGGGVEPVGNRRRHAQTLRRTGAEWRHFQSGSAGRQILLAGIV